MRPLARVLAGSVALALAFAAGGCDSMPSFKLGSKTGASAAKAPA